MQRRSWLLLAFPPRCTHACTSAPITHAYRIDMARATPHRRMRTARMHTARATLYISTFWHACTQAGRLYDADIHDCNMRGTHVATQGASHAPCGEQTLVVQGFPAYTGACMWQPVCAREICASGAASERSERPGEARRERKGHFGDAQSRGQEYSRRICRSFTCAARRTGRVVPPCKTARNSGSFSLWISKRNRWNSEPSPWTGNGVRLGSRSGPETLGRPNPRPSYATEWASTAASTRRGRIAGSTRDRTTMRGRSFSSIFLKSEAALPGCLAVVSVGPRRACMLVTVPMRRGLRRRRLTTR